VRIRDATPGDGDAITQVHEAAFGEGHGATVANLVAALRRRDRDGTVSLVAVDRGRVVGHIMFTPGLVDATERLVTISILSPLGVLPAHQRQGVGRALIERGLERVDELDTPIVVLEGDPAYYSRHGFEAGRDSGLRRPSLRIPEEAFQCRHLSSWKEWMCGTVVYAEPFWDLDAVGLRERVRGDR
jgi:putative acetyltransferase